MWKQRAKSRYLGWRVKEPFGTPGPLPFDPGNIVQLGGLVGMLGFSRDLLLFCRTWNREIFTRRGMRLEPSSVLEGKRVGWCVWKMLELQCLRGFAFRLRLGGARAENPFARGFSKLSTPPSRRKLGWRCAPRRWGRIHQRIPSLVNWTLFFTFPGPRCPSASSSAFGRRRGLELRRTVKREVKVRFGSRPQWWFSR